MITGFAELLRARDDDATRVEAARRLAEAAERLRVLHAELLDELERRV